MSEDGIVPMSEIQQQSNTEGDQEDPQQKHKRETTMIQIPKNLLENTRGGHTTRQVAGRNQPLSINQMSLSIRQSSQLDAESSY